jgi:hypothetical protein
MAYAVSDGTTCTMSCLACTMPFVAPVCQQWPPMPSDIKCALTVRPDMGKRRPIVGEGVRRGPATSAVGPTHGLTSARWLGLVGGGELLVRTGSRGRGGNLTCEWVVASEVGDGEVVMRIAKYSETERSRRANRQVLRGYLVVRTVRYSDGQPYAPCSKPSSLVLLIHGHLARPAQPDTSTNWHRHDPHEHDAARRSSCLCRAGTTCRARGTARTRGHFFVSCRHEARLRARRAVCAVPARGPAPLLHLIQEQISQGCQ